MKFRDGFVSNSSSSSYIIAVNKGSKSVSEHINFIAEMLFPSNLECESQWFSFYQELTVEIAKHLLHNAKYYDDVDRYSKDYKKENYYHDDEELENNRGVELLEEGWQIYVGEVGNEGCDNIDTFLYYHQDQIKYDSENLIIEFGE